MNGDSLFGERMRDLHLLTQRLMDAHAVPGVQLGLIDGDNEAASALGISDIRGGGPTDDDTAFRISSITKTFTATVLVHLAQERRLDLDDPVRRYVPEFALADPRVADAVTIRHLLLHTGGWVPHLERIADGPNALTDGAPTQVHATQVSPPGALFSYNGVGYMIAGRVIEVVMGCLHEEAVRSVLLGPLEMKRTFFATESDANTAADHTVKSGKAEPFAPFDEGGRWPLPSGGLRSTSRDLLRYARCHFGETSILSPQAAAAMSEPQASLPAPHESKALSWFVRDLGHERLLLHLGGAVGQQSLLAICPRRRFALVVLTNSAVGNGVHAAVLSWALEVFLQARESEAPTPIRLADGEIAEHEGRFVHPEADLILSRANDGLAMRLEYKGLYAQRPTPPPARLRFWERDRVIGSDGFAAGQYGDFLRGNDGRVAYFRWGGRARPRADN